MVECEHDGPRSLLDCSAGKGEGLVCEKAMCLALDQAVHANDSHPAQGGRGVEVAVGVGHEVLRQRRAKVMVAGDNERRESLGKSVEELCILASRAVVRNVSSDCHKSDVGERGDFVENAL